MCTFICSFLFLFAIFTCVQVFIDIHSYAHTSLVLILAGDKKSLLTASVLDQLTISSIEDSWNAVANCVGGFVWFAYRYVVGPHVIKRVST